MYALLQRESRQDIRSHSVQRQAPPSTVSRLLNSFGLSRNFVLLRLYSSNVVVASVATAATGRDTHGPERKQSKRVEIHGKRYFLCWRDHTHERTD